MKCDIVLAGVGGQGILTIAAMVAKVAMQEGLNVKQSEVHGMSQRGGDVSAHLRLSSDIIYSDLIADGTADVVLAMEPMEALRHARCLATSGVIITNANPIVNIQNYPELEKIHDAISAFPRHLILNGEEIAKKVGNALSANMAILGALTTCLPLDEKLFRKVIEDKFAKKGQAVVDVNLNAFSLGREAAATL